MRQGLLLILVGVFLLAWSGVGHGEGSVTQGQFVVVLAKRLSTCGPALCKDNDPVGCAQGLKALGIEPFGTWRLDQPITDAQIAEIAGDIIAACREKKLACTPQRAVDLLVATCVDLGLNSRDVYMAAYTTLGYYFPPPYATGAGGGKTISPSK